MGAMSEDAAAMMRNAPIAAQPTLSPSAPSMRAPIERDDEADDRQRDRDQHQDQRGDAEPVAGGGGDDRRHGGSEAAGAGSVMARA